MQRTPRRAERSEAGDQDAGAPLITYRPSQGLIDQPIDVGPKPTGVNRRQHPELLDEGSRRETAPPRRTKLGDPLTVTSDRHALGGRDLANRLSVRISRVSTRRLIHKASRSRGLQQEGRLQKFTPVTPAARRTTRQASPRGHTSLLQA